MRVIDGRFGRAGFPVVLEAGRAVLSGDILGDWREEVIWRTSNDTALRIYSTPHETNTRITTLLHDTQYRSALAWQNTGYNQPPHPSFFIGSGMPAAPRPTVYTP